MNRLSRWIRSRVGRQALLLAVLVAVSFFANLGGAPLFDEDEGAYAEVTREMLASGDFITPRLNGQVFFHKPPLIYWVQAASTAVLGFNEAALRLPSALASLAWVLVLFRFARRYAGQSTAWYAAVFLVSGLQSGLIAKAAIADALLNLFVTLTCFEIFHFFRCGRRRHIFGAYGFMALGVLAKGPIAVVIPLVASGGFFLWEKRFKDWLKAVFHPGGWLLFLSVAVPWYAALYRIHGEAFIQEIFFTQNVDRFRVAFEGHGGSLLYYVPVVILGMMPHTAYLLRVMGGLRRMLRRDVNRFGLIWFVFVFVFFSVAGTKLHHYVVYGYPPLFLFMAQSVGRVNKRLAVSAWPIGFTAALCLLPLVIWVVIPRITDEFARLVVAGVAADIRPDYILVTVLALGAFGALAAVRRVSRPLFVWGNAMVFVLLVNGYVIPLVGSVMQSPIKEAAAIARNRALPVVMWQMTYHSFGVYRGAIVENRTPRVGEVVITKVNKLESVARHEVIYEKNGIVMTRILSFKEK